jgi:HAMP domain-containing protein
MTIPFCMRPRHNSISRAVGIWTLLASVTGMMVYTMAEYLIEPPTNLPAFLLHHVMHVAIIGIAVWWASMKVVRRFVTKPASDVFIHLHRMASGRIDYLDMKVETDEINDVAGSINRLVGKLRRETDPDATSHILDKLRILRLELRKITSQLGDDGVPVMKSLVLLEEEMLGMLHLADDQPASGRIGIETYPLET